MAMLRILCVEDELALLHDMAEELQSAGYEVLTATQVAEAIKVLEHEAPDLILCDVMLPGGQDGYDLHRYVREERPDLDNVPLLFLTALGHRDAMLKGLTQGVDDYLLKPIDYDLLLAVIAGRLAQVRRLTASHGEGNALASFQELFAQLPGAVLLCDDKGHLLYANSAAKRLAEQGIWHASSQGQLQWPGIVPASVKALRECMQHVHEPEEAFKPCLALKCAQGDESLLASLIRLDIPGVGQERHVAMFLASAQARPLPNEEALRMMFSLTQTEAKITLLLAQGLRPEAIAQLLQVSNSTVAFHLRNVYVKTGRRRQSDVVALVLTAGWVLPESAS